MSEPKTKTVQVIVFPRTLSVSEMATLKERLPGIAMLEIDHTGWLVQSSETPQGCLKIMKELFGYSGYAEVAQKPRLRPNELTFCTE